MKTSFVKYIAFLILGVGMLGKNIYDDPDYVDVQEMLHEKLDSLLEYYGDSDENNQRFLKEYLEHRN